MNILWVPRSEWGASASTEKFIRERVADPPEAKTEIHVHHTASVDGDDTTPNRWDYDEAETYMRRLEWVRPDLGPLPYSENLAVSEDAETVWVFQGRGILTRGAHTGGHNVPGVGWGVFGNFDKPDVPAAQAAVDAIQSQAVGYKQSITPNLGQELNPFGWEAWGHRDTSTKTCPGHSLYPLLESFTLSGDMPLSDEDIRRIWAFPSLVGPEDNRIHMQQAVSRGTNLSQAIYNFLTVDANTVDEQELDAAVSSLVENLPDAVVDKLRERLG